MWRGRQIIILSSYIFHWRRLEKVQKYENFPRNNLILFCNVRNAIEMFFNGIGNFLFYIISISILLQIKSNENRFSRFSQLQTDQTRKDQQKWVVGKVSLYHFCISKCWMTNPTWVALRAKNCINCWEKLHDSQPRKV